MSTPYTVIPNLSAHHEIEESGTLSQTLLNNDQLKAVWFGFAAGEELSDHTSTMPAILHVLRGEALLTLGDDRVQAQAGTWVHMPPNLNHSVLAKTEMMMLLILIKTKES